MEGHTLAVQTRVVSDLVAVVVASHLVGIVHAVTNAVASLLVRYADRAPRTVRKSALELVRLARVVTVLLVRVVHTVYEPIAQFAGVQAVR